MPSQEQPEAAIGGIKVSMAISKPDMERVGLICEAIFKSEASSVFIVLEGFNLEHQELGRRGRCQRRQT